MVHLFDSPPKHLACLPFAPQFHPSVFFCSLCLRNLLMGHLTSEAGMVFHFIPWFQKYDVPSGPIGLSDTVIVTDEGGRRVGRMPLTITVLDAEGREVKK